MRAFTPEISWHNRLPVLSLDISPPVDEAGKVYKIATGGNDCRVFIWHINTQSKEPDIEIRAGLRRHQKSVGAVRFSSQNVLASGDDDGYIYIWRHKNEESQPSNAFLDDDEFDDQEVWQQIKVLRGHIEDICDLSWSRDGQLLLSGSVDNSAILWDTAKGTKIWCSDVMKGYVQGVAMDPLLQFMVAISSDRTLRVYNFNDKRLINAARKMNIRGDYKAFFCDDTLQTFCRRLDFSPDGQFLLAPASRIVERTDSPGRPSNVFLAFKRPCFNKPTHYYPTGKEVALCARFSPVTYQLKEGEHNFWGLPYRVVFAVATNKSILIYDSQQSTPIGYASQIHLARITDIAWSNDGRLLMISSYDGYITLLTFADGEFGTSYAGPMIETEQVEKVEEVAPKLPVQPPPVTMWRFLKRRA